MSDEFTAEPVIGHHVGAEVYEPESALGNVLDDVAESYGIPRRDSRRVRITCGDVDWDYTETLSIDVETFEEIIEWYENTQ